MRCNPKANNWTCCSDTKPCGIDEGDCDSNADCAGDLICGTDNCPSGSDKNMDCCISKGDCTSRIDNFLNEKKEYAIK